MQTPERKREAVVGKNTLEGLRSKVTVLTGKIEQRIARLNARVNGVKQELDMNQAKQTQLAEHEKAQLEEAKTLNQSSETTTRFMASVDPTQFITSVQTAAYQFYLESYLNHNKQGSSSEKFLDKVESAILSASGIQFSENDDAEELKGNRKDLLDIGHSRTLEKKKEENDSRILGTLDKLDQTLQKEAVNKVFVTMMAVLRKILQSGKINDSDQRTFLNCAKALNRFGLNSVGIWSECVRNLILRNPDPSILTFAKRLHYDNFVGQKKGEDDYKPLLKDILKDFGKDKSVEYLLNAYLEPDKYPRQSFAISAVNQVADCKKFLDDLKGQFDLRILNKKLGFLDKPFTEEQKGEIKQLLHDLQAILPGKDHKADSKNRINSQEVVETFQIRLVKFYVKAYIAYIEQPGEDYFEAFQKAIKWASGMNKKGGKEKSAVNDPKNILSLGESKALKSRTDSVVLSAVDELPQKVQLEIVREVFKSLLNTLKELANYTGNKKDDSYKKIERSFMNGMKAMNRIGVNCVSAWTECVNQLYNLDRDRMKPVTDLLHYDSFVRKGESDFEALLKNKLFDVVQGGKLATNIVDKYLGMSDSPRLKAGS